MWLGLRAIADNGVELKSVTATPSGTGSTETNCNQHTLTLSLESKQPGCKSKWIDFWPTSDFLAFLHNNKICTSVYVAEYIAVYLRTHAGIYRCGIADIIDLWIIKSARRSLSCRGQIYRHDCSVSALDNIRWFWLLGWWWWLGLLWCPWWS